MHSRVWAGEARSGEGTLAPPPFLFGCHDSVSSAFRWGGNACVPRRSYASNGNPSRRGECGEEWLGGPSWSPVGWSGDTLTIHRQAQFSRRLTTYHHKSPPDSLLVILSVTCHPERQRRISFPSERVPQAS